MDVLSTIAGVRISLASPALIRAWSSGEVTRADTLNYLTQQPEPGGLFCQRIFGPLKDGRCACTRPKRAYIPGVVCKTCGVEPAPSRVRRERMGHIELAVPVVHHWFARGTQSVLALLLAMSPRQLAALVAYHRFLVTDIDEEARQAAIQQCRTDGEPGAECSRLLASLAVGDMLDEAKYREVTLSTENGVRIQSGGAAIRHLLTALDLPALATTLRQQLRTGEGHQKHLLTRLHLIEGLRHSGTDPTWMVMDVLPVLPPDLRPLVRVGGNRLAASDLNTLYARVLHRNARVRRFLELDAPTSMLHYEQRLLQEACDALFDPLQSRSASHRSQPRPLKSLTEALSGKHGHFRRHLLGKRVDYSGRSVICVGPDLHLHQCGPRDAQRDGIADPEKLAES